MGQIATIGDIVSILFCILIGFYLWQRSRRDINIEVLTHWQERHDKVTEQQETRIRSTEEYVTRVLALQESASLRVTGIEKEIENLRKLKHEISNILMKHEGQISRIMQGKER